MATPSKLAVILHADVVGSTVLVRMDERIAHSRIRDAFRRLSETITVYGGTARELRGDALVAEFARASDAVLAALACQVANTEHNRMLGDEFRPEVRIGIAQGEVVIADDTVTGTGVVLAEGIEGEQRLGRRNLVSIRKRPPWRFRIRCEQNAVLLLLHLSMAYAIDKWRHI